MAGGVARRFEHARFERADLDLVVLAHRHIDQGDARGLALGRDDAARIVLLEFRDAAGVVGMMMGHEDIGEPPAGRFQRRLDRRGLGRVDRRGRAAFGIVQEHAEIVLEAGEEMDLRRHVDRSPDA